MLDTKRDGSGLARRGGVVNEWIGSSLVSGVFHFAHLLAYDVARLLCGVLTYGHVILACNGKFAHCVSLNVVPIVPP